MHLVGYFDPCGILLSRYFHPSFEFFLIEFRIQLEVRTISFYNQFKSQFKKLEVSEIDHSPAQRMCDSVISTNIDQTFITA